MPENPPPNPGPAFELTGEPPQETVPQGDDICKDSPPVPWSLLEIVAIETDGMTLQRIAGRLQRGQIQLTDARRLNLARTFVTAALRELTLGTQLTPPGYKTLPRCAS